MARLTLPVRLGQYANDGTGDDLRTAFERVNNSFSDLLVSAPIESATNLGPTTGNAAGLFAGKNGVSLEFKGLTSTGSSVAITRPNATSVNLEAVTRLQSDTIPTLGGNLNLNNFYISNGDVRTTVNSYDVRVLANLVSLMLPAFTASNNAGFNINFGTITSPAAPSIDMGTISPVPNVNRLDFGTIA
jgi:hypothetical protein